MATRMDAVAFVQTVRDRFQSDGEKYDKFIQIMTDFKSKKIDHAGVMLRLTDFLEGHNDLISDLSTFAPKDYVIKLPDEEKKPAVKFQDAIGFVAKIKYRFQDDESVYNSFLDILNAYGREKKSISEVHRAVKTLFQDHHDLLNEFAYFLNKRDNEERDDENSQHDSRDLDKFSKPPRLADDLSEFDLSKFPRSTPSYRLLPKHYQAPPGRHRNELGASVLNDSCVSTASGREDRSFKCMNKNQYEETLFRCEDDKFELDMLIESVETTAKKVEKLIHKIQNNRVKSEGPICMKEHLSSMNMRCIEILYGDYGPEFIDYLHSHASLALPVLLTSLRQKKEEMLRCRSDFNNVWVGVYAKNLHRSLDHRSFHFKQEDAKNLSKQALLVEIEEISKKKRKEDDAFAATDQQPTRPDMEYEYIDPDIHEDMHQIIKYSCGKFFTSSELVDKIMRIWTNFLEPALGVPSRPLGAEDTEDEVKSRIHSAKGDSASARGSNGCPGSDNVLLPKERHDMWPVSANGGGTTESNKVHQYPESSGNCNNSNVKREDGELSPNEDVEDDKIVSFEDGGTDVVPKVMGASPDRQYHLRHGEKASGKAALHNDADDESEESRQTYAEDSETGEEVPGSELTDGNEDAMAGRDCEAKGLADAHDTERGFASSSLSDGFLHTVIPLAQFAPSALHDKRNNGSHIFYGNDAFYVLYRFHQTLYERLLSAKTNSAAAERQWRSIKGTDPPDIYAKFMDVLYNLLNGSADNRKFEDDCLAMIGTHSYTLFTLDKLIHKIVKQLEAVALDEMDNKLLQLYAYEKSRQFFDTTYRENARLLLHDENIYRFECFSNLKRLSIQLIEYEHEQREATTGYIDPPSTPFLSNELFPSVLDEKEINVVSMRRYKRTDEIMKSTEGTLLLKGLENKISCNNSQASHAHNSEDYLRLRKRRRSG